MKMWDAEAVSCSPALSAPSPCSAVVSANQIIWPRDEWKPFARSLIDSRTRYRPASCAIRIFAVLAKKKEEKERIVRSPHKPYTHLLLHTPTTTGDKKQLMPHSPFSWKYIFLSFQFSFRIRTCVN
jgi:hypothetical protein